MIQNKYQRYLLVIVFFSIILFPKINSFFSIVTDIDSSENRQMASLPVADINHLDIYPSEFNKFFNDNFPLRDRCIEAYNNFVLQFYHKSPIPDQLVLGSDGYLFSSGNELKSYEGKNSLTIDELKTFTQELEYRKKYLAKRNCAFYVLVAPVKAVIYNDKMPSNITRIYEKSWGQQLTNYLEKNSSVNTINLYDSFKLIKDSLQLYYKLDNHWNELGAFYGVAEFIKRANKQFPSLENYPISQYNINTAATNGGNIVHMLSNNKNFLDTKYTITTMKPFDNSKDTILKHRCIDYFPYCDEYEFRNSYKNDKNNIKPKLLIISDSFGGAFYPFASTHFRETVKIFDAWQYKLNEPIVEIEKPDIVILIMLESNIRNLLNYTSCPDIK